MLSWQRSWKASSSARQALSDKPELRFIGLASIGKEAGTDQGWHGSLADEDPNL